MHDPQALHRLSAKAFQRWMWYEQVEPFGELRADYRMAILATHIANTGYDTTESGPFKVEDFLPKFEERKAVAPKAEKQSVEEQVRILTIIAHAFAGAPRE